MESIEDAQNKLGIQTQTIGSGRYDTYTTKKVDMSLSGDSAFHIANAIISSNLKLEDRLICSNE